MWRRGNYVDVRLSWVCSLILIGREKAGIQKLEKTPVSSTLVCDSIKSPGVRFANVLFVTTQRQSLHLQIWESVGFSN